MAQIPKRQIQQRSATFNGGWNPRSTPLHVRDFGGAPMQSPDLKNCDFFYHSAVSKRLGKAQWGNSVDGGVPYVTQTTNNTAEFFDPTGADVTAQCFKFVPGASKSVASARISLQTHISQPFTLFRFTIRADAAGDPGAVLTNGTSVSVTSLIPWVGAKKDIELSFPIAPALTSGTTYWLCAEMTTDASVEPDAWATGRNSGSTTPTDVKGTRDNYSTFVNLGAAGEGYYVIEATSPPILGLFDYKREESGTVFQNVLAAVNGSIYYQNDPDNPAAWTSIQSGLATAQDDIYDFLAFKGLAFSCDHATNLNRVWDSSSTGMMVHGYRMSPGYVTGGKSEAITSFTGSFTANVASTDGIYVGQEVWLKGGALDPTIRVVGSFVANTSVTFTEPAALDETTLEWNGQTLAEAAGTGTFTNNVYKIMAVTKLVSGGYRASAVSSILMSGAASKKITVSGIAANSSTDGTEFGFDIAPAATTWFMTDGTTTGATADVFYKIPTAFLTPAVNPQSNATTSFDINAFAAATLTAENTLQVEFGLPQAYFTLQVDAPRAKFFGNKPFQNFMTMAGDPAHPSRVWFSEFLAPQVWTTFGQTLGTFIDVTPNDGEIVTGLYVWQGRLFVYKTKSAYVISFTGNALRPFNQDRVQGNIGCLSHWSIRETPKGMVMISQQGPAICYGAYMRIIPEARNILNKFERNDPDQFNLSAMSVATSLNNEAKFQIWWSVATQGATYRNEVLMYDYEQEIFWPNDGINANYFANIVDTQGAPRPFSGNNNGKVFEHDSGNNDDDTPIQWEFSTPNISFNNIAEDEKPDHMWLSGEVQSSGSIYVDHYIDFETTPSFTYEFDMTDSRFKAGLSVPLSGQGEYHRFVLRNSDLDVPVRVESMRIDYARLGTQQ